MKIGHSRAEAGSRSEIASTLVLHQRRLFAKACPEPDFKYRSNSAALRSFENAM
jgi:hypothetical protein